MGLFLHVLPILCFIHLSPFIINYFYVFIPSFIYLSVVLLFVSGVCFLSGLHLFILYITISYLECVS